MDIKNRFLGPGAIPFDLDCTGHTKQNTGLSCIHIIKECVENNEPLQLYHFYSHWRLRDPEEYQPINPRLLVLNPAVCRTRGRPRGASNLPTASQASTAEPDQSTEREPSQHEYVLADENLSLRCGRGRGRGRHGRGHGRGRGVQGR